MSAITLKLLGQFACEQNGVPIVRFRTLKSQALLIYLAVEAKNPQPRERLMALLWPDLPLKSAQTNLRQVCYQLKQALPGPPNLPLLLSDRRTIQINPEFPVTVDVQQFWSLVAETKKHDHSDLVTCQSCLQALQKAVEHYEGPFLADFFLADSNAFEDWSFSIRESLRQAALTALGILADAYLQTQAYGLAGEFIQRQLKIDNLRESAYQQHMELLARSGLRHEASQQYELLQRLLDEELGMTPSARTTQLWQNIASGELDESSTPEQKIRGYNILELIGQGSYGDVYRAYQPSIDRVVAVKVIRPEFANIAAFIRAFEAEARIIARLEHAHIVPLYDFWRDPNGAFLVMRYMPGGTLQTLLAQGKVEPQRAVTLVRQIASALTEAHRQGIVHRDVKPSNIALDENGNAYLTDFGIARDVLKPVADLPRHPEATAPTRYSPPEELLGEPISHLSDQYALGLLAFQLFTGHVPHLGVTTSGRLGKGGHEPLPFIHELCPGLAPDVDDVIARATAPSPEARYQEIDQFAAALECALDRGSTQDALPTLVERRQLTNPYKGLHPYQEADARLFFGREQLVNDLLERLEDSPDFNGHRGHFLALVGPSGSGKSSLAKAGLIPALRQNGIPGSSSWYILDMMPGNKPLEELEAALMRIAVDPPSSLLEPLLKDERGLVRVLKRILPPEEADVLMLVDQFEELFTLAGKQDREQFIALLIAAVEEMRCRVHVLVTLRADFYDRPLENGKLGQLLKDGTVLVLPLDPQQLSDVISKPAAEAEMRLEAGLVDLIIREVGDRPGTLPLLQHALMQLFERRDGDLLTLEAYREIGGVRGALGQQAEELYLALDENSRDVAKQLLLRLVTLGEGVEDTRRRVLLTELNDLGYLESADASMSIESVLDRFGHSRLLTFDRDLATRTPTVEVAHEALLKAWPRMRHWLDENRTDLRMQRILHLSAHEWAAADGDSGYLLRGSRLDQFDSWAQDTNLSLTREERTFLDASRAARTVRLQEEAHRQAKEAALERRSRRVSRALVFVLGAAFIGALTLTAFAFGQRQEAVVAYSQSLAAIVDNELSTGDTATALALAVVANDISQPPELAQLMLRQSAYAPGPRQLYDVATLFPDVTGRIYSVAASPTSGEVLIGFEDGSLYVWDMETGTTIRRLDGHKGTVRALAFSPDGRSALTGGSDGVLYWWDLASGELLHRFAGHAGWIRTIAFSPDGQLAVSGGFTGYDNNAVAQPGELLLWDLNEKVERHRFEGHPSGVVAADFTLDGQSILASSGMFANIDTIYTLYLWDVVTGNRIREFELSGNDDNFSLAISPDGQHALTGTNNNEAIIWDLQSGKAVQVLGDHPGQLVTSVRYLPRGGYAVVGDANGMMTLWDLGSGKPRMRTGIQTPSIGGWHATDAPVFNIAVHHEGRRALTSAGDGTLVLWDLVDAAEIRRLAGHATPVLGGVAFTPDGKQVLTGEAGKL